jgi:ketosteroid isomerase-like protein
MNPATGNKITTKQVQGIYAQWLAGYDARDADKVMAVFDPELRFTTRGAPDQDFAALKENYAREFKSGNPPVTWKKVAEEIYADNTLTTVVSQWQWNVKPTPIEPVAEGLIRCVDVLRLSAGGWKIVRTVIYREV